jgi:flagellar basal body-associated protein FliL
VPQFVGLTRIVALSDTTNQWLAPSVVVAVAGVIVAIWLGAKSANGAQRDAEAKRLSDAKANGVQEQKDRDAVVIENYRTRVMSLENQLSQANLVIQRRDHTIELRDKRIETLEDELRNCRR